MRYSRTIYVLIIFSISTITAYDQLDFTQFNMDYTSEYTYSSGLSTVLPFDLDVSGDVNLKD